MTLALKYTGPRVDEQRSRPFENRRDFVGSEVVNDLQLLRQPSFEFRRISNAELNNPETAADCRLFIKQIVINRMSEKSGAKVLSEAEMLERFASMQLNDQVKLIFNNCPTRYLQVDIGGKNLEGFRYLEANDVIIWQSRFPTKVHGSTKKNFPTRAASQKFDRQSEVFSAV